MKAQCERCKEIVALEFTLGEGGIHVTCPACAQRYFVTSGPRPDAPPPPAPRPAAPPASLPPAPPGAAEAFARCEETWEDDGLHDAFLAACRDAGSYAYAAARYRLAAADAARAEQAEARLKLIRTLAEQALHAAVRAEKPIPRGHALRWVAAALFLAILAVGIYLYLRRK
ncbi:MAG TPA: hypothetical protein VKE22_06210 [Haliangiales bacterium]|nr:hypothetical protein [Haliangiales bacterium]